MICVSSPHSAPYCFMKIHRQEPKYFFTPSVFTVGQGNTLESLQLQSLSPKKHYLLQVIQAQPQGQVKWSQVIQYIHHHTGKEDLGAEMNVKSTGVKKGNEWILVVNFDDHAIKKNVSAPSKLGQSATSTSTCHRSGPRLNEWDLWRGA